MQVERSLRRVLVLGCLALILNFGCTDHIMYSEFRNLPSAGWLANDSLSFVVDVKDTVHPFDMYLHVRNDLDYPFSNLFLITSMVDPSGRGVRDTLEYEMAAPNGKWLGKGVGSLRESKLWYREREFFKESGEYRFTVQHAMRRSGEIEGLENLTGITHLGLEIERSN